MFPIYLFKSSIKKLGLSPILYLNWMVQFRKKDSMWVLHHLILPMWNVRQCGSLALNFPYVSLCESNHPIPAGNWRQFLFGVWQQMAMKSFEKGSHTMEMQDSIKKKKRGIYRVCEWAKELAGKTKKKKKKTLFPKKQRHILLFDVRAWKLCLYSFKMEVLCLLCISFIKLIQTNLRLSSTNPHYAKGSKWKVPRKPTRKIYQAYRENE